LLPGISDQQSDRQGVRKQVK